MTGLVDDHDFVGDPHYSVDDLEKPFETVATVVLVTVLSTLSAVLVMVFIPWGGLF